MFGLHASAKTAGVDDDRKAKPCYDPADCVLTGLPIDLCLQFREGACLLVLDVAGSAWDFADELASRVQPTDVDGLVQIVTVLRHVRRRVEVVVVRRSAVVSPFVDPFTKYPYSTIHRPFMVGAGHDGARRWLAIGPSMDRPSRYQRMTKAAPLSTDYWAEGPPWDENPQPRLQPATAAGTSTAGSVKVGVSAVCKLVITYLIDDLPAEFVLTWET